MMQQLEIYISICLLWINSSYGQDCLYENYFKLCGAAHSNYSSNLFEEAREKYKIAFKSVDFQLGTDLVNALLVSRQVKDTTWAYEMTVQLAKGGVPIEYFKDFEHYAWYIQFRHEYPGYRKHYEDYFDLEAREKFLELCLRDSTFNTSYHEFRKGKINMSLDNLIDGATEIFDSLKSLIYSHGFPCEQIMGYYYQGSEVKRYPITPLLIHIYQRGELFYIDRLSKISCDGKLRPVDAFDVSRFRGFGDSTGIEQEMKIRWQKYSGQK